MVNGANAFGLILVAISSLAFVLAMPDMVRSFDTDSGSPLENETAGVKAIYNVMPSFLPLFFLALIGMGLLMAIGVFQ